jgi:phosphate transport system protein
MTRVQYQGALAALEERTLGGIDLVVETLGRTIEAIEHRDMELAGMVIADDDRIDGRYLEVHQSILTLLATQAPVATDLRLIAALLHLIKSIERMGDQCVNIAKLIPLSGHDAPTDEGMLSDIVTMGRHVRALLGQSKMAFATRDVGLARDLVRADDVVDDLNRECFRTAIEIGEDQDRREWAMTMLLVARALERMGDNAVDIGEQTAFVVTGLFEEFEDASHPPPPPEDPVPGAAPAP